MDVTGHMPLPATIGLIVVVCVFIAGHAWGWGPMTWLVCSEVQPLHTRAAGTALATVANFLLTFVIGQCFLSMLCAMKWGVFLFFAGKQRVGTVVVTLLHQRSLHHERRIIKEVGLLQ
jgi:hypothetical protein